MLKYNTDRDRIHLTCFAAVTSLEPVSGIVEPLYDSKWQLNGPLEPVSGIVEPLYDSKWQLI